MLKKAIPLLLLLGFELSHGAATNNEIITRVYSWKEGDKQKFGEIPSPDADAELAFTVKNFPAKNENGDTLIWKFKKIQSISDPSTISTSPLHTLVGMITYIDAYSDTIDQEILDDLKSGKFSASFEEISPPNTNTNAIREELLKYFSLYAFIKKDSEAYNKWNSHFKPSLTKERIDAYAISGFNILEPKPAIAIRPNKDEQRHLHLTEIPLAPMPPMTKSLNNTLEIYFW